MLQKLREFMFSSWKTLASILGVASAVILGVLAWGRYNRRAASISDSIVGEGALLKIAEARGRREELMRQDELDEEAIETVDRELSENQRRLSEIRQRAEIADDELEAEFARLGFLFIFIQVTGWSA